MQEPIDLGRAIAFWRGSRSQAEVAARAGLSPVSWSHYETGKRVPRKENVEKLLRGLDCTLLQLEETAWRFRRQRLIDQQARSHAGKSNQDGATAGLGLGEPAPSRELNRILSATEPAEQNLRRLIEQHSAVLEQILLLLLRSLR